MWARLLTHLPALCATRHFVSPKHESALFRTTMAHEIDTILRAKEEERRGLHAGGGGRIGLTPEDVKQAAYRAKTELGRYMGMHGPSSNSVIISHTHGGGLPPLGFASGS